MTGIEKLRAQVEVGTTPNIVVPRALMRDILHEIERDCALSECTVNVNVSGDCVDKAPRLSCQGYNFETPVCSCTDTASVASVNCGSSDATGKGDSSRIICDDTGPLYESILLSGLCEYVKFNESIQDVNRCNNSIADFLKSERLIDKLEAARTEMIRRSLFGCCENEFCQAKMISDGDGESDVL